MHICIEIILSELSLQRCQIYKHHYCKDMVWDMDSTPPPPQFILSFVYRVWVTTHCVHFIGILFLSDSFAQVVFLYSKACYYISFHFILHHSVKIKQSYSMVV